MNIHSEMVVALLKKKLEEKKAIDRAFSLRSFAKELKMGSGRLSELFSGKRNVTDRMIVGWVPNEVFNEEERRNLTAFLGEKSVPENILNQYGKSFSEKNPNAHFDLDSGNVQQESVSS